MVTWKNSTTGQTMKMSIKCMYMYKSFTEFDMEYITA